MVEMFGVTIKVHLFFILMLLVLIVRNLIILYTESNFIILAKKIRFPTAMLHTLMAVTFFTGILLMSLPYTYNLSVKFNPLSIVMIIFTIFIMLAEIKRYKKLRVIESGEIKKQQEFIKFAKTIYILDVILIFSIFFIHKLMV
jgi:hypothetical protein